jgi:hypothetical protein
LKHWFMPFVINGIRVSTVLFVPFCHYVITIQCPRSIEYH